MRDLARNHEHRRRFLRRLYETVGGDTSQWVSEREIASQIGMKVQDIDRVTDFLEDGGFIAWTRGSDAGGHVSLTHAGVLEAERAMAEDEPQRAPAAARGLGAEYSQAKEVTDDTTREIITEAKAIATAIEANEPPLPGVVLRAKRLAQLLDDK